jgi:putative phage-type endonuclease
MDYSKYEKPLQWHLDRQKGIGGSDIGKILGLSKYGSPLSVYYEKIAESPEIKPMNEAMIMGLVLEPAVAERYTMETAHKVQRVNQQIIHPDYDYLRVNLDRKIVGTGRATAGVLEMKTASGNAARNWDQGIPSSYYAQLVLQMMCSGCQWGEIALLTDGRDFKVFEFERDLEFEKMILEATSTFWNDHVLKRIPPPAIRTEDVLQQHPSHVDGKVVEASQASQQAYGHIIRLDKSIAQLVEQKTKHVLTIQDEMGDAEKIVVDGKALATWKKSKDSRRVDSSRLKKEKPEIYEEYSKFSAGSRRFNIKK